MIELNYSKITVRSFFNKERKRQCNFNFLKSLQHNDFQSNIELF